MSGNGIHWSGVPNSANLFTTAYGIGSNSRIGATIVDSQIILTNKNITIIQVFCVLTVLPISPCTPI